MTTSRSIAASALFIGFAILAPLANAVEETEQVKPSRSMKGPEARNNNPEGEGLAKSAPSRLGKSDRAFMTKAGGNGLFEIEAARLASERASDPAIKSLAASLTKDHRAALDSLSKVALAHNYPLPEQVPEDKRAVLARLAAVKGPDFDRAFRAEIGVKAHEADIKMFERASRATRTADLKAWIEQTLPKLEEHLKHALDIKAS